LFLFSVQNVFSVLYVFSVLHILQLRSIVERVISLSFQGLSAVTAILCHTFRQELLRIIRFVSSYLKFLDLITINQQMDLDSVNKLNYLFIYIHYAHKKHSSVHHSLHST